MNQRAFKLSIATARRFTPINRAILINQIINERTDIIRRTPFLNNVQNREWQLNENPRCFIAIEIENKTWAKHRIGSIVNASAMGKIGIVVTDSESDFDKIVKIREYLEFLQLVGKTKYDPQNLMIVLAEDLFEVLDRATR